MAWEDLQAGILGEFAEVAYLFDRKEDLMLEQRRSTRAQYKAAWRRNERELKRLQGKPPQTRAEREAENTYRKLKRREKRPVAPHRAAAGLRAATARWSGRQRADQLRPVDGALERA